MRELESTICWKCHQVFQNLGWDVSQEERTEDADYRFDLVLRNNGKLYGFIEVVCSENLTRKAAALCNIIDGYIKENKIPIFVITNGNVYDLYIAGEFWGVLSVPPTPKNIDVFLGGECSE